MTNSPSRSLEDFLTYFFLEYFDQAIRGYVLDDNDPTISASICLALECAVGKQVFENFLEHNQKTGSIVVIADYQNAEASVPCLVVRDYCG